MGDGVVERTLVCLWVDWMGIEGGGAIAVMDQWRISIFDLERNVVISYFQQERLWKMGGDDMEKALVRWCVDLVRIEGTGAADVLISWMEAIVHGENFVIAWPTPGAARF